MRFWRWVPAILLLLLVGLPAFPPLIAYALQEGLSAAKFTGRWQAVGGYLLEGLELRGVELEGHGLRLEAQRLRIGYNLLSLRRRELPLRLLVEEGDVYLRWDAIIPEQPQPAAPAPIRLRVGELVLNRVGVQIEQSQRYVLPNLRASVRGSGPYQVSVRLPEGRLSATVRRTGRESEAWQIEAKGDLRAARYWFAGFESGELEGTWTIGPKVKNGILGKNQIKQATVKIVGFTLTEIFGSVDFDGQRVTANLVGRGLEGPLKGAATVDLPGQEYRFRVEGNPTLPALAAHFGLRLPVSGGGPLVLEGRGWQNVVIDGRYSGEGRLLGEPLTYQGTLAFDKKFRLDAAVEGAFFDRTFQASLALRNTDEYSLGLRDSLQSNLRLTGKGARTEAEGTLVWPRPLLGEARLRFVSSGSRWRLGVQSEEVGLPTAKPFSLSGSLQGEGSRVQGQLGPLNLTGTWDDLQMRLVGLELLVGQLTGQAALKAGRLSGNLSYDSPYTRFPIAVEQDGQTWRLSNRWASGVYRNGVFSLGVRDLPLEILEPLKLSGDLRYAQGKLSGGWTLRGERLGLEGELYDLATRYQGEVRTPLRVLALRGTAKSTGLEARLETLRITADGRGLWLQGPLELGQQIRLEANLGLQNSRYRGEVRFDTPWLSGVLEGRGASLWATADGYAQLSGPVWPTTALRGRLTLPLAGWLEVPAVPLEVSRTEVRWPGGRVALKAGFPFEGSLPLLVNGEPGSLEAKGSLERGQLELKTPFGRLNAEGSWRNLTVQGQLNYAGYLGQLQGQADLFGLAYQGRLQVPRLAGALEFRGRGTRLSYAGRLQNGRLTFAGDYRLVAGKPLEGLRLRAIASDYDLSGWGLAGTLRGSWSEQGGRLSLRTPYGEAQVSGSSLLGPASLEAQSPYGRLRGLVGRESVRLEGSLRLPYVSGTVAVFGPWNRLEARGQGRYDLPYLEPENWQLRADLLAQTWKLEGPLELEGQGLSYTARLNWPYRAWGRLGVLQGRLEGEGLRLQGGLQTTYAGLPLSAFLQAEGADLKRLRATLELPEGRVQLAHQEAVFDLETAPLARLWGAEVAGRLRGRLDLSEVLRGGAALPPQGALEGALRVYGQQLELGYKDRALSAFLPAYRVGALVEFEPGRDPRIVGTGDLEGALRVGEQLEGRLTYRARDIDLQAKIAGSRLRPEFSLVATTPIAKLAVQGNYALQQNRGQAQLELESPYAQASLELFSLGNRYQANGRLASLQYLRQSGPLRLTGEGTRWALAWAAPMRVEAQGQGASPEQVRLAGQGELELGGRHLALSGGMALVGETFTGQMRAQGAQISLDLLGQDRHLLARGTAYGVSIAARTNRQGQLSGQVGYTRSLAANTLKARGALSGSLWAPVLRGEGSLVGRGAEVALRFGYGLEAPGGEQGPSAGPPGGWLAPLWVQAEGPGLSARFAQGLLKLRMDSDLEPFVGLPLHLKTSGEGPWETLRLPLALSGPGLEATGTAFPAGLRLQLQGRYQQQRFNLHYDRFLQVRLEGPYATGTARWAKDAPSGLLQLDLPLPGGRLVGQAHLEEGRVILEGREGWQGTLQAWLREGWREPTRWELQAGLEAPLPAQNTQGTTPSQSARVSLQGRFALDAAPLALRGHAEVQVPEWGAVQLHAQDGTIDLRGLAGLAPLRGRLRLRPLQLDWSYLGALPRGLGSLEAGGTYPGRWVVGQYQVAGQSLRLEGQETRLRLYAPGLEARLTPEGLEARLQGYNLSGLGLSGRIAGPWDGLEGNLDWEALGRKGAIEATWRQNRLQASLRGDLAGWLSYSQTWTGRLDFREGWLELFGAGLPTLEGQVLGLALRLRYPSLQVAPGREGLDRHLRVDLAERSATGELEVRNLVVRGQGPGLEAVYPLAGGRLLAGLDLKTLAVRLSAPELGSGELGFQQGQLDGALYLTAYGLGLALEGAGRQINLRAVHPESEWLPWKSGSLSGQIGLDGGWRLLYRDTEQKQQIEGQGRLLQASMTAKGPWIEGQLRYPGPGSWQGRLQLDLPLKPLASRLRLLVEGEEALSASGTLSGGVGSLEVQGALSRDGLRARAGFKDLAIEEVPQITSRLPFLTGRASGLVEYNQGQLEFNFASPGLRVKGDELALATQARGTFSNGVLQAEIGLERTGQPGWEGDPPAGRLGSNRTTARVRLENGILSGEALAASFPLHWLFSTWAGDLAGQAFWTGRASFSYNIGNPWASKGIWVGEYLRFQGGGDTLVGTAALRFEQERLYIDQLGLSGKGTWTGSGYYGRRGSNLRLSLENTSFTPVLQVIPNLKPLAPEGGGTLRLYANGASFDLTLENFSFKLGPVRAETPRAVLRVGNTASAEGRIKLTAPYPAEAQLSGEGDLSNFTVRASGRANLPLLSPDEPFDLSFNYPAYTVDARLQKQEARLYGTLFPQLILTLQGRVPVRYPQYFLLEGLLESNLILRYQRGAYIVQGAADVVRARLGFPEGQRELTIAAPLEPSTPRSANLVPVEFANVQLKADRGIIIQETLAQGELAGELYLNGDLANPFLSGEVVPLRGSFRLWDRDFTIRDRAPDQRSYARFSPAAGILPELQIVADTQVQDQGQDNRRIQINLTLKGKFLRQNGRIKVNLTPSFEAVYNNETARKTDGQPYTEAEIYALLLLGRSDLSALPADIAQTGLQAAIQNFIVGQLERELAKALRLDQVRVEIPALNGGAIEETRFTIGRYLSPELFFAYSVDLRGYQTVFAEYLQGDYRLRFSTEVFPQPRPEISFGWTIRPIGADLTLELATGVGDAFRGDGIRFGIGFTFRF